MNSKYSKFVFGRFEHCKATGVIGILVLALFAGEGCGKSSKNESAVAATPSPSDSNAAKMATTPPANWTRPPATSGSTNDSGLTQIQILNRAVLGWKMKNHRRPRSFEDFASTAGFQIPLPPAGKKYALDSKGFIILVNSN